MILTAGDKLLVVHRRLFAGDAVRFFTCKVEEYEDGIVRVSGHTWIRDPVGGRMLRKQDESTKIVALSAGSIMAYVLPQSADMSTLTFEVDERGGLWLSDGAGFKMDLREQWSE